ncbi:uncharacterized protein [Montipora foliosa]|uniref:uncharacterized protein n=1 Tax=Montipora foliosa TaxID=591990 RepID=UPI0035F1AB6B
MVIMLNKGEFFFTEGLKDCVYERERLLVSGVDDFALPQCDGEGKYKPIQCSYGWDLKCWCADENGNAYSNTSVYSSTPDCSEEALRGRPTVCEKQRDDILNFKDDKLDMKRYAIAYLRTGSYAPVIYTTGMALYLLTKPPIIRYLVKQILWFRNREGYALIDGSGEEMEGHKDTGYLKIIFYFYQAADLLIIGSAESLLHGKIPFVLSIVEAFNFEIGTLEKYISCPFAEITAVTKELLRSGTVFLIMAEIVTIYCFHFAFNKIRRKEGPCAIHYIAVFIELLLLGYERLAESSLNLMNCFPIGSEKRLFIDAEIVCWQWWQYILLTYIIVSVVPFILVLYFGSSKLHHSSISAKEFLGACTFPLLFLVYWLFKKVLITGNNTPHDRQNNKEVVEVLYGPFRHPKGNDNGTLYWESVLIGRRLALLLCHAFITNSMLRLVCMTVACIAIVIHHALKSPFQDPIANRSETASLFILAVIAVINLTKATLVSFGITIGGPATTYLEILDWFEVCVLAFVPALLGMFVAMTALSQLVRLFAFFREMIRPKLDFVCR